MSTKSLLSITLALLVFGPVSSRAERPPEPKQDADLIVTGRVGKVYTNTDSVNVNFIVEIEVQTTQKGQAFPSGQILDARCFQRRRDAPRVPAAYGHHQVPREGETIRAHLMRRPDGRYEGTYPDWVDPMGGVTPDGGSPGAAARYPYWALGIFTQPVRLGDRVGLQITQVVGGGAAQRVGLEAGDVILEAGGEPTRSPDDLLRAISRSGGSLKLTIRDVRTGRLSTVEVALNPL
jgi:membrane-associated protease RseP (regulator of RpoE activity)